MEERRKMSSTWLTSSISTETVRGAAAAPGSTTMEERKLMQAYTHPPQRCRAVETAMRGQGRCGSRSGSASGWRSRRRRMLQSISLSVCTSMRWAFRAFSRFRMLARLTASCVRRLYRSSMDGSSQPVDAPDGHGLPTGDQNNDTTVQRLGNSCQAQSQPGPWADVDDDDGLDAWLWREQARRRHTYDGGTIGAAGIALLRPSSLLQFRIIEAEFALGVRRGATRVARWALMEVALAGVGESGRPRCG
ncbi:hypothetical protein IWX50DRAFT_614530 [Phyllosticta citricarpa]